MTVHRAGAFLGRLRKVIGLELVSLIAWQIANYAIPLALLPYFGRVLGVSGFGVYGIALGVLNVCMMITDWGFLYTSQRALVEASGEIARERDIVWETATAKLMLALLCSLALFAIVAWLGFKSPYAIPLLAGIPALIANALSLEWLLRAKEMFSTFAVASVAGRAFSIPFALLTVKSPYDSAWAIASVSFGLLLAAVLSIVLARGVKFGAIQFPVTRALYRIRDGLPLFIPLAAVNLYTVMIPPLVGVLSGPSQAGLYTGADRMKAAARMLFYPLTIVAYPRINNLRVNDPVALRSYLPRLITVMFFSSAAICSVLALSAKLVVYMFLGQDFYEAVIVLQVLAAGAFVSSLSTLLGTNVLVALGMNRAFLVSHLIGIGIGVAVVIAMTNAHGALGAAIGVLFGESVTLAVLAISIVRSEPWVFGRA
ncbi:O-antigen/teichoic acid export membrane protein [Bradyrhizobium sp. LB14.3]|uniref:oligosaccharide flippase family protein n=1 Tax=Bradyrhizobium sp. LB14.3 TaxID=3156328 RepID=UPI0033929267